MFKLGRCFAFQFGNDALGKHFAQLDAPLVERINVPNHALRENTMFVKCDERAENSRSEAVGKDYI